MSATPSTPKGSCGTLPKYVQMFDGFFRRPLIQMQSQIDPKVKYPVQHKVGRDAGVYTIPKLLKATKLSIEMAAEIKRVRRPFKGDPDEAARLTRFVENDYWSYIKGNLKDYIKWLGRVFYKEVGLIPRMEGIPVNDDVDCNEFYIQYMETADKIPVVYTDKREVNLSICVAEKGVRPSWRKREATIKTAKQHRKHGGLTRAERHQLETMIRGEDVPGLFYEGS